MQFIEDKNKRSPIIDCGDDTFERFLSETSHQDTLISSYYMNNDDNQVEITEVFEINETTLPIISTTQEPDSSSSRLSPTVEIEEIFDDDDNDNLTKSTHQLSGTPIISSN